MNIFKKNDYKEFENFTNKVETVKLDINDYAKESDIAGIEKFLSNFKLKTEDFSRENRKLNIGVVGQVKAGKSSFLNTLLFDTIGSKNPNGIKHTTFPKRLIIVIFHP